MKISKLNFITISLYFLAILASVFLTIVLIERQQKDLLIQRSSIILELASDAVRQDLKLGLNGEVYRRCKTLYSKHGLAAIKIINSNNEIICEFGTINVSSLSKTLYYDSSEQTTLGNIYIEFKTALAVESFFSNYGVLLLLFSVILICVAVLTRYLYNRYLFNPIVDLNLNLQSTTQKDSINILDKKNYKLIEIEKLKQTLVTLFKKNEEQTSQLIENKKAETKISMARQVAHDIRSPLTALKLVLSNTENINDQVRTIVRLAVNRITDIANGLLENTKLNQEFENNHEQFSHLSIELVSYLVESVVTEKRNQFLLNNELQIFTNLENAYGLFSEINPIEFQRIISNILNNSIDALPDKKGKIEINLSEFTKDSKKILLTISDTGKGIPQEILSRLGKQGETYGKKDGSGLGLYHAFKNIEHWGGSISIESSEQAEWSTKISILLNCSEAPKWFLNVIKIKKNTTIVILDDDLTIHHFWDQRLNSFLRTGHISKIIYFKTSNEIINWYQESFNENESYLFLSDYELIKSSESGLDVIKRLNIEYNSILITSHAEDVYIRTTCEQMGIKLIPKNLANLVPIEAIYE